MIKLVILMAFFFFMDLFKSTGRPSRGSRRSRSDH